MLCPRYSGLLIPLSLLSLSFGKAIHIYDKNALSFLAIDKEKTYFLLFGVNCYYYYFLYFEKLFDSVCNHSMKMSNVKHL